MIDSIGLHPDDLETTGHCLSGTLQTRSPIELGPEDVRPCPPSIANIVAAIAAICLALSSAGPAAGASAAAAAGPSAPARTVRPPNVVVLLIDALRADGLGCYGAQRPTSPVIDALARRGTRFEQALSVGGNTGTAMPAFMSGRLPFFIPGQEWTDHVRFGMWRFYDETQCGLPPTAPVLAEMLHDHGYTTAGFITNPILKRIFGFNRGFDHYEEHLAAGDPSRVYIPADEVCTAAINWLATAPPQPFFMYVHIMDVHEPYTLREPCHRRFGFKLVPGHTNAEVNTRWTKLSGKGDPSYPSIAEHMRGCYDCEIELADTWIGHLIEALEQGSLKERTILIVTADHGDQFLEHGGTGHRGALYDEILHVPLIIAGPGIPHREVSSLVRNFDVMPTVLELAGIKEPLPELDAVSLVPLIRSKTDTLSLRGYANFPFDHVPGSTLVRVIRDEHTKLIHRPEKPGHDQLFDIEHDPGEQVNLLKTRPKLHAAMLTELNAIAAKLIAEDRLRGRRVPQTLLHASPGAPAALRSGAGSRLTRGPDRITVEPVDGDRLPTIITPTLPPRAQASTLLIRAELSADEPVWLAILARTADPAALPDSSSATVLLTPGEQTVLVEVPVPAVTDRLELVLLRPVRLMIRELEVIDLGSRQEGTAPRPADGGTLMDSETEAQLRALGYLGG